MRILRALIRRGPALALAAAFAISPARSAHLPDWAETIAAAPPQIPPGVPATPTKILLSEIRYAVQPDGTYLISRRLAVQSLSVLKEGVSIGSYQFEETAQVIVSRAWHLSPDEAVRRSHAAPVDITVGDAFLTTSKARLIPVDNVRKGSLVFFEFEAREKPYFLTLTNLFLETAPVAVARFELEVPAGWSARWAWIQGKGPDPTVSGSLRSWEIKDLPAPVKEDLAPPPEDQAPLLGVNLSPPPGATVVAATFPDWVAVSRWYEGLARGRDAVTPAIEAAARHTPSSEGTSPVDQLLAATTMVRDRVRYVAVELGIGGFQPHAAADTLTNLYGDCKDKGTLLKSMLEVGGITSHPLLVNAGGRLSFPAEFPILAFNHLVVAAEIPPDVALPARCDSALVKDSEFGRLLVLDSTDEFSPAGSLPASLAGQNAVLVAGDKGKLITLPPAQPSSHRLERRIHFTVLPEGTASMRVETKRYGETARAARADYGRSSSDRRRSTEDGWTRSWPGSSVGEYNVEPETTDGAFTEACTISGIPLTGTGTGSDLPLFPGASRDLERVPLAKRRSPVDYGFPRTLHHHVEVDGLSSRVALPEDKRIEGDGWTVEMKVRRTGSGVEADGDIRLSRTRFDPEAFPELRRFWSAASILDGTVIAVAP